MEDLIEEAGDAVPQLLKDVRERLDESGHECAHELHERLHEAHDVRRIREEVDECQHDRHDGIDQLGDDVRIAEDVEELDDRVEQDREQLRKSSCEALYQRADERDQRAENIREPLDQSVQKVDDHWHKPVEKVRQVLRDRVHEREQDRHCPVDDVRQGVRQRRYYVRYQLADDVAELRVVALRVEDRFRELPEERRPGSAHVLEDRQEDRAERVLRRPGALLEHLQIVVELPEGVEHVVAHDRPGVVRFLRQLVEPVRACRDERIQILRRLPEELHCRGVALRVVLNLSERVQNVPVDRLGVAEVALAVRNCNAELRVGFSRGTGSGGRGLHAHEVPPHGAAHGLEGDVDELGRVLELLDALRAHAGHGSRREHVVSVGRRVLRSRDERLAYGRRRRSCRRRRGHEAFPDVREDFLQLAVLRGVVLGRLGVLLLRLRVLLERVGRVLRLLLVGVEALLRCDDLAPERHELFAVLVDALRLQLRLGVLQLAELLLRLPDSVAEELLLLPQEFRVLRVELEQAVDVLQLFLCVGYFFVNSGERL